MAKFILQDKEDDTLELVIHGESFFIPLATSLTLKEAASMKTTEGAISFFEKFIREDVTESLKVSHWKAIIDEWNAASEKAAHGTTPGES